MKKVISIILVLISLMQISPVWAEGETAVSLDNTIKKLQYFGMIKPEMATKATQTITRGEFAEILIYYLGKTDKVPKATGVYFYDVPTKNKYASYINYMLDLGYAKKDITGTFLPDERITTKDAAMFLLRAMGYGELMDQSIDSPGISNAYSKLTRGVATKDGIITVGGIIKMFDNALDVPMYAISVTTKNGEVSFNNKDIFLNAYFKIYEVKGRIDSTCLTSLYENFTVQENEVAIDKIPYCIADNMSHITDFLGYQVKAYYRENDEKENVIIYFEDDRTDEVVIKASEFLNYEDNKITYIKEDASKSKTVTFEKGAYLIYNGQLLTEYSADIFKIKNGSIELVGTLNNYDVVKIYDYTDIVIGGVSQETGIIYSKYTKDVYDMSEYDEVIIRDRYGRRMTKEEISSEMVASVGVSGDKELLILNISGEKVTGVLNSAEKDGDTMVWTIDGKEYYFNGTLEYAIRPVNAKVTVYLNYLNKIAYIISGKNENQFYGYLIKANQNDELDSLIVKIYTEEGKVEDYKTKDEVSIDGDKLAGKEALTALSYDQPTAMKPTDTVQPQLIKYGVNSEGILTKIDTARVAKKENKEVSLSKNVSAEDREYLTELKRLMGKGEDKSNFKLDCLVGEKTKVFIVPGKIEEAKIEYGAYSVAGPMYFENEKSYIVDVYDTDFQNGAEAGVVVVRLASTVEAPRETALSSMLLVTRVGTTINSEDNVVTEITGYSYSSNSMITLQDFADARVFEKKAIEPGDIIRYGYVNNNITGCDIDLKIEKQLNVGYSVAPKIVANWHYDHIFAAYRLLVGQVVDINGKYMYYSYSATDKSTMKDCAMIYDLSNTKIFVFDKNNSRNKLEKIDAAQLREYTYKNNENAKVVVYSSFASAKMVVVYI